MSFDRIMIQPLLDENKCVGSNPVFHSRVSRLNTKVSHRSEAAKPINSR